jgi:hypothetical protein
MNKFSRESCEIEVTESAEHGPAMVLYGKKKTQVESVICHWRINQEWWKRPVERDYFRVRLVDGVICELFRDNSSGCWQLQRVYD